LPITSNAGSVPRPSRLTAGVLAAFAMLVAAPACAAATERQATPQTFAATFADAAAGDTIRLAAGDYGVFRGALKSGTVTIAPQPGAVASMQVIFKPASNITLDGLRITDAEIGGLQTKNVTIRNSTFDGAQLVLRSGTLANANILLDHNTHSNFVKCTGCYEGRVQLAERTDQPDGVTISNSRFYGGNSDGIQNGGNGTRIIGNEFYEIHQVDGSSVHADSIQLYGSKNTVIQGNWFHDVATGVMCADGCDHELIQDNVFAVTGSPYAMTFLSDDGSVIRHNTYRDHGICDYNARCGTLYLGNKPADPASRGTVLVDNIVGRICVCIGSVSGLAEEHHNLLTAVASSGLADLLDLPTFLGGLAPATFAGYALAPGSPGSKSASDGLDRGVRIANVMTGDPVTSTPDPTGTSPTTPTTPTKPGKPAKPKSSLRVTVLSSLASAARSGRLRLKLQTSVAGRAVVRVSVRPGRGIRGRVAPSRKTLRLKAVTLGQVEPGAHGVTARLSSTARRRLRRARDARLTIRATVGSLRVTAAKLLK